MQWDCKNAWFWHDLKKLCFYFIFFYFIGYNPAPILSLVGICYDMMSPCLVNCFLGVFSLSYKRGLSCHWVKNSNEFQIIHYKGAGLVFSWDKDVYFQFQLLINTLISDLVLWFVLDSLCWWLLWTVYVRFNLGSEALPNPPPLPYAYLSPAQIDESYLLLEVHKLLP